MLHIISQLFDRRRYTGNPMGITTQCNDCGRTYDELQGQLDSCEFCDENYCEEHMSDHKAQHMSEPGSY